MTIMKNFNEWLGSFNENQAEISTEAITDVNQTDISADVDTIINSLETLANELTEELENIDVEEVYEGTADNVVDYVFRAPKARKAQKKVNAINLKVAGLEAAASAIQGDASKKEQIKDKIDLMKSQASELQSAVDDKFSSYSTIVKKALSSEKIKGKLEVIKASMGDKRGDNKELQKQSAKLKQRLQDEEKALSDAKPSDSEIERAREASNENNSKRNIIERYKTILNKSEDADTKEFIQEKIDQVSSKEAWQIEGTHLGQMFEDELIKLESKEILNESKYQNLSIKDRFSKLI